MKAKRCPFCNAHEFHIDMNQLLFWVHCLDCGASGPGGYTKKSAVEKWNGRHRHTNPAALVANRKSNHHELKEIE